MDLIALLDTDPLAAIALWGLVLVLVVTLAIFVFLIIKIASRPTDASHTRDAKGRTGGS